MVESRTLEITASMRDFVSRTIRTMGRTFIRVIRASFLAPLRLLQNSLRFARGALVAFSAAALPLFAIFRGGQTIRGIVDSADALSKLGSSTGSTTERISGLGVAFQFAGIEGERFSAILTGLGRARAAVLRGSSPAQAAAFQGLGVTNDQLRANDPVEIFAQIARGLSRYNSAQEQANALQPIFVDNFQRLLPLLGQGEAAFRSLTNEARAYGAELDERLGRVAETVNDELLRLDTISSDIGRRGVLGFLEDFLPELRAINTFLSENRGELQNLVESLVRAGVDFGIVFIEVALEFASIVLKAVATLRSDLADAIQEFRGAGVDFGPFGSASFDFQFLEDFEEFLRGSTSASQADLNRSVIQIFERLNDEIRELEAAERRLAGIRSDSVELSAYEKDVEDAREAVAETEKLIDAIRRISEARDFSQTRQEDTFLTDAAGLIGGPGEFQEALGIAQGVGALGQTSQLLERLRALLRDAKDETAEFERNSDGVRENFEELSALEEDLWIPFSSGVEQATESLLDFQGTALQAGRQITNVAFNGLVDALTDVVTGVKTAQEAFQEFGRIVVTELVRVIIQLLVIRAISGLVSLFAGGGESTQTVEQARQGLNPDLIASIDRGNAAAASASGGVAFAKGGIGPGPLKGSLPVRAFARGGVATEPMIGIFGEGPTNEAFVPLPDGRRIPVDLRGGGGGGGGLVINISAVDARGVRQLLIDERDTLLGIYENGLRNRPGLQRTVQRISR